MKLIKMKLMQEQFFGKCCWMGTIDELLLDFDRGSFMKMMKREAREVSEYETSVKQYPAWRDEFKQLRNYFKKLGAKYRRLHVALEYVLPGWPDKGGLCYNIRVKEMAMSDDDKNDERPSRLYSLPETFERKGQFVCRHTAVKGNV